MESNPTVPTVSNSYTFLIQEMSHCVCSDKQPDMLSNSVHLTKEDEVDQASSTASTARSKSEAPMQVIPGVRIHLTSNHVDETAKLPRYGVETPDTAAMEKVCESDN